MKASFRDIMDATSINPAVTTRMAKNLEVI